MTSIVIAAHDEASVIERCLDAVLGDADPDEFEVIVVANGCTDATANVAAQRHGVIVIELPTAGKIGALNAGDAAANGYPRIYLDADIIVPATGIRELCRALAAKGTDGNETLAVTACRKVDVSRSSLLVRGYFAINSRLPAFRNALFGRGIIALSAKGRERFDAFPDVVADDLFLDSLFSKQEKCEIPAVISRVMAPRTTQDLMRRLIRVRRGNASLRSVSREGWAATGTVRKSDQFSWIRDVVVPRPALMPAAVCYMVLTVVAEVLARRPGQSGSWGRDDSSRIQGDM